MSSQDDFLCKYCGEIFTQEDCKWCKPCQINNLKQNFTNWTSGNEKIDELIQEMQIEIDKYDDVIVEWIPYNQFNDVKEISKDDYATLYSARWVDGPLKYDCDKKKYERTPDKNVALKLYNSKNNTSEFLSEV
jgi:hypothetical protein